MRTFAFSYSPADSTPNDIVSHFEARQAALEGKGMIVCMSRRICVALYDAIIKIRPEWHSDDDAAGATKVVMTGAASDPPEWQRHIGKRPKPRREDIGKRAKAPSDPLKLVIVRDMWLTGFDAPCMHTMYVDKPMKGHSLMQVIARVNRVFRDKPAGLVVDYIGVAQNLKNALGQYSPGDRDQTGIDEAQAVVVLMEKYEVVWAIFRPDTPNGFNYRPALDARATPQSRLAIMAGAASDAARGIREDVAFFQAVRAALVKRLPGDGKRSTADRELAIQQIVSRAVISTEIVDIMKAAGLQAKAFTERLEAAICDITPTPSPRRRCLRN
jgi:type I restriction enzyme R subunit